jgi:mRNA interferase HicA
LQTGQKCPILELLKGSEFVRKIKRLGKRREVSVRLEHKRGKGSHATLYYGPARTVI